MISWRSIKARLYYGFGLLNVIALGVACLATYELTTISTQVNLLETLGQNTNRTITVGYYLEGLRRSILRYAYDQDAGTITETRQIGKELAGMMKMAEERATNDERRKAYQKLEAELPSLMAMTDDQQAAGQQATDGKAKLLQIGDKLSEETNKLVEMFKDDPGLAPLTQNIASQMMTLRMINWRSQSTLDAKAEEPLRRVQKKALDALDELAKADTDGKTGASVSALNALVKTYADDALAVANSMIKLHDTQILKIAPLIQQMQGEMNAVTDGATKNFANVIDTTTASVSGIATQQQIMAGISLLLGIAIALLVSRSIIRPLAEMTNGMRRLASGDLAADVPGLGRTDELGEMAKAVEIFKTEGLRAKALEEEAARERAAAEAERNRVEAERAAVARSQARVVEDLSAGLARLSDGDLTVRVSAFPQDYHQLETDFNAAISKLEDTLALITANGRSITSGSSEITQASDELSQRTEQQAASLEETAASLEQITATVKKTAEGARHARDVVGTARADAEGSGQVVEQAVAAMSGIEKSSAEITQIIGVIDEIAFQTNLLALNAGVEAARAGEAGRGFAVVASEVRALAQRSAEAAKQIKALIATSTAQVASGVSLVGDTGKALTRIVQQVADIAQVVNEIAASAQEQAVGLEQVNTAVSQMDQITQQNAAMVEETTAASHSLAKEAQQLNTLIGQFKVERQIEMPQTSRAGSKPAPQSPRPVKPSAAKPTAPIKPMDKSRFAASRPMKPSFATSKPSSIGTSSRHSAAATARKVDVDQDSWEEF